MELGRQVKVVVGTYGGRVEDLDLLGLLDGLLGLLHRIRSRRVDVLEGEAEMEQVSMSIPRP